MSTQGDGQVDVRPACLRVLAEALQQLATADTRASILAAFCTYARQLVQADGVAIVLRQGECFHARADAAGEVLWQGQHCPLMSCITGWSLLRQETVVVEDVSSDPRVLHAVHRPCCVVSVVMVPVRHGEAGAAVGVYWNASRKPGDAAVALLETLARATGGALERCVADEQVRTSGLCQRAMSGNTLVGLAVAGADGRLVETNARFAGMLGYAPHETVGRMLLALSHHDDAQALERLVTQLGRGGIDRFDREQRYLHKTGIQVWTSSAWWRLERPAGEPCQIAVALLDITHQKEVEAQLAWTQRMEALGQLAGAIAHDFNNLLTVVNGCAEMLAEAAAGEPKLRQLVAIVQAAGEKGAVLTDRLLSFARCDETRPQLLYPDKVLLDMRAMLSATLGEGIALELSLDCPGVALVADPAGFEKAVLNLVLNARDAMARGGTLAVATSLAGAGTHAEKCVVISVRDTGAGMAPEVRVRAFEPFFTTKARGVGKGLGLSMVYGFARRARGTATLYSRIGAGTEVRICLPLGSAELQHPYPCAALPAGSGERVLVVEEDDPVREHLVQTLGALGYRAYAVAGITAALALLAAGQDFDVLMGEQAVLGEPGAAAPAGAVLALRPTLKILLTASQPGQPGGDCGPAQPALLYKPFRCRELALALARLLGKPH